MGITHSSCTKLSQAELPCESTSTHRYGYPHKLAIPPDRDGIDDAPLADAEVAEAEPEEDGDEEAVRVHERRAREDEREVIHDVRRGGGVREPGRDRGGERGADEEREDERGQRPEGPVEVRRGREVGALVGRRAWGEHGHVASLEDLCRGRGQWEVGSGSGGTYGLGVDVEVWLEVLECPELAGSCILPVSCGNHRSVCTLCTTARQLCARG